ncbi:MAG: hypothetical protein AB7S71_14665 [Dongiaceae bacterium]
MQDNSRLVVLSIPIVSHRLLVPIAMALLLAACQVDVFLGYGLPANDACRDADTLPGRPLSTDCLDSLGN